MPNIKDVARKAGVSVASVSRVMNNRGYISIELKEKVFKAMEEIEYYPNELARNFQKSRTKIIGLIVPDIHHSFFSTITLNIEMELRKKGYKLLLCNAMNSENLEESYITMLRNNQVDGVIIGSHTLKLESYLKLKLPIVALDRYLGENIPLVTSDHYEGGLLAARELMISGCSRIVQIQAHKGTGLTSDERHKALDKYFKDRGIECISLELPLNEFNFDHYRTVAGDLLDKYKPDGIFAEDIVACAILKEALIRNIAIPETLKIVGYDGTPLSKIISPSLTTVAQPIELIARNIIELLIAQIEEKENIPKKVMLPVSLVKGQTS